MEKVCDAAQSSVSPTSVAMVASWRRSALCVVRCCVYINSPPTPPCCCVYPPPTTIFPGVSSWNTKFTQFLSLKAEFVSLFLLFRCGDRWGIRRLSYVFSHGVREKPFLFLAVNGSPSWTYFQIYLLPSILPPPPRLLKNILILSLTAILTHPRLRS